MDHARNGKTLTVLNVAFPLFPVNAGSGGGAEQIVHALDKGLVQAGMRSIVIAAEGSTVAGELVQTPTADGEISDSVREQAQIVHRRAIENALVRDEIDIVHFHGLDFLSYRFPNNKTPQLATLHLPLSWYPSNLFQVSGFALNVVSESQRNSDPAAHVLPVVRNGIDLDFYRPGATRCRDYVLWLGRICPEKGTDIALRVAHRIDMPLIVAGPVHPFSAHREYFTEQVEPLLDDERRCIGAVAATEKADLLANARCLLVPSIAPETSSLVAMEAISSGTPVVAFRSGALPEIVEEGVTGFVVGNEQEMVDAVRKVGEISAEACRERAEARFSARRMVTDYQRLYQSILSEHVSKVG